MFFHPGGHCDLWQLCSLPSAVGGCRLLEGEREMLGGGGGGGVVRGEQGEGGMWGGGGGGGL